MGELRTFSTKAIIAGVLLGLVTLISNSIGPEISGGGAQMYWTPPAVYSSPWGEYQAEGFIYMLSYVTFVIVVIAVINQIAKRPFFTRGETTVITLLLFLGIMMKTAGATGHYWMSFYGQFYGSGPDCYLWGVDYEACWTLLPSFHQPQSVEAIQAMIQPGATPDWPLVTPLIGWVILFALSFILMTLFISLLFRHVWIEVESLPFPSAVFHTELIRSTQPDETGRVNFFTNKYFAIGLVICFTWVAISCLKHIYVPGWNFETSAVKWTGGERGEFHKVWEPGHLPWEDSPYIYPAITVESEHLLGFPYSEIILNFTPWLIGWGFLNTIPNLTGAVVAGIIFTLVIPPMLERLAIWPETAEGWAYESVVLRGVPGDYALAFWGWFFAFGGLLAYTFYPLWRNRARFSPVIRGLYQKVDADKESPIPYRFLWIGGILSFVGAVASGVISEVPVGAMFAFVLINTVLFITYWKLVAETGGYWGGLSAVEGWSYLPTHLIGAITAYAFGLYGEMTRPNYMSWFFFCLSCCSLVTSTIYLLMMRGGFITLHNFKVAATEKLDKTKLLMWSLVVIVIGFIISAFVDIWHMYIVKTVEGIYYGITMDFHEWSASGLQDPDQVGYLSKSVLDYAFGTNLPFTISYAVIGFVVVMVLMLVGRRFVGPAGFLLGALVGAHIWSAWLVALILKWLVIRVGGMSLYREKAQPLFIGCLVGWLLACFINDITMILWGWHLTVTGYIS